MDKHIEILLKQLEKAKTEKEMLAIFEENMSAHECPDELIHEIQHLTDAHIQQAQMKEALPYAQLLTFLRPTHDRFWILLGMLYMHLEHYERALLVLGTASIINVANPTPEYMACVCLKKLGRLEEAELSLERANNII